MPLEYEYDAVWRAAKLRTPFCGRNFVRPQNELEIETGIVSMKNALIPCCLLLLHCQTVFAQQSVFKIVPPESVGLDADKLAEIEPVMQKEVDEGRIIGCSALVAREGKVAYFKAWGQQDAEKKVPMQADTIFRIYSMSKPITSVAVMQLVEQGKIDLDDPIEKYLPALADQKVLQTKDGESKEVEAKRSITVRDLLRHTSGLTYGFFSNTKVDEAYRKAGVLMTDATIEQTVDKLGKIPLLYQPGSRWHYSVSTDVLGRLVEVASEQRFDEYLQEHIFAPLDMKDTSFMVPKEKQSRLSVLYRPAGKTLKPTGLMQNYRFVTAENTYFSGGGGLCSTTRDYLRFCMALLSGGELDGKRIIKTETLAQMTKDQLGDTVNARFGFKFGLGFAIRAEGEYSWGGAAGTRFWINPERKLITIYMIQINPYGGRKYGEQWKKVVYAADTTRGAQKDTPTAPMP